MNAVYIIMMIAAIIALLLLIPINVIVSFAVNSDENEIRIKVLFWDKRIFPVVKESSPKTSVEVKEKEKKKLSASDIKALLKKFKAVYSAVRDDVKKLINYLLTKALAVKELNVSAVLGTGDPMYSGILYGTVNGAVYGVLGMAHAKMKVKKHNVDIKADFDNAKLAAGIYAVVYVRILSIFSAAFRALWIYLKVRKTLKEVNINE